MASTSAWLAGARPRTLPAAVAPVLIGTGAAFALERGDVVGAALALVVAVALQVGVNYANDYSDGVRGTDDVGARVVVRRQLPDGGLGDLLGELRRWDDVVVVRDRTGADHAVARADVVAAKRVPPPPARR